MTPRPDTQSAARKALAELTSVVEWLAASLLPGTHKPYSAPPASAEKRAERARLNEQREAAAWSLKQPMERIPMIPLGESPAPMDLDVLDLLVECLVAADDLAETVADAAGVARLAAATSAYADPGPFLRFVALHLASVGRCNEACALPGGCGHVSAEDVCATVLRRCEALVFRARSMLGLVTDGQLLAATCPFCGGRTSKHPVGGAQTLRVRLVKVHSLTHVDEFEMLPAIVCEGGACKPPSEAAGTIRHKGMPTWFLDTEGSWLARQIEAAAEEMAEVEAVVAGLAS